MMAILRQSAVQFNAEPQNVQQRGNWNVVLKYQSEGDGPWLVDLAHKPRLDLQDKNIAARKAGRVAVPEIPGISCLADGILVNRMNNSQASVYCLGKEGCSIELDTAYSDVTDATVFLALLGPKIFCITEKLTSLDFQAQDKKPPFLHQGPFCHVPCQIVTLQKKGDDSGGILLTCSRGYAKSMVEAIVDAGAEFGLQPAGENRFSTWLEGVTF